MQFTTESLERMMAEMNEAHASIAEVEARLADISATVKSKDRVINVTVDSQGLISELKLTGQSWREMSAKELTAKIIETVTQAQNEVRESSAALLAELSPEGMDPATGLPDGVEMESMMKGIIAQFGEVSDE